MSGSPRLRVGVDTGGTFTDFVCDDGQGWRAFKLPSTPASPARAVLEGLSELAGVREVVHGTTVATNAALEGRGARTAFVTTAGFRDLLAQAAHIPVHLGSMGFAVRGVLEALTLEEGDVALLNDPYRGGTHLPDLTVVAPVFAGGQLVGYAATRAHHADLGGSSPGSMPVARSLAEEGLVIGPCKLLEHGRVNAAVLEPILAAVRTTGRSRRPDRRHAPPGAAGGRPGKRGRNVLVTEVGPRGPIEGAASEPLPGGEPPPGPGNQKTCSTPPAGTSSAGTSSARHSELLPGKVTRTWKAGDLLRIETPGGGGWGEPAGCVRAGGRRRRQ
jgi:N-methylhydantoinase B/oxoprolinase/acetone carboxylase alpha subunit